MSVRIDCGVYIEELASSCSSSKRTMKFDKARVSLVKSDHSEVFIRVKPADSSRKSLGYKVSEPKFFTKFVHEGKSTITLKAKPVNIMLRNCPPDSLKFFLVNVKEYWKLSKDVKIKRENLFNRDTSLSKLDELGPVQKPIEHATNVEPNPSPTVTLSPIMSKKCKPSGMKRILSSTPVRERPPSKLRPRISAPAVLFDEDADAAFTKGILERRKNAELCKGKEEQKSVMELVKMGYNVFCTGGAGTGKSYLLKRIIGTLPPSETAVMASTGVAASLIGGTTVHNFSGVGHLLDTEDFEDLSPAWLNKVTQRIAADSRLCARWKAIKHIIIDEVSMLSTRVFTRLEAVARIALSKFDEKIPFGGIQVILFGDFFQLPPVLPPTPTYVKRKKYAFQSSVWRACGFRCVELQTTWRQAGDAHFARLLNEVREGRSPAWVVQALHSRVAAPPTAETTTRLCTHRRDADSYNEERLRALKGPEKVFTAKSFGPNYLVAQTLPSVPDKIVLKVGAQVMLLRNLDVSRGLVNGARGVVESFTPAAQGGFPMVLFYSSTATAAHIPKSSVLIQPERWSASVDQGATSTGVQVSKVQLPLCLAWAVSIHKSQGITLDSVEVDLSKVFEHGQAYVALSRCRSLDGLRLLTWSGDFIRVDPKVNEFYDSLRKRSKALDES